MNTNNYKLIVLITMLASFQAVFAFPTHNTGFSSSELPPNFEINLADNDFEKYVGRYHIQDTDFQYATVTVEDGKLYGQPQGQERVELVPREQEGHFYIPSMDITVQFTRDDQDEVSGVTIVTNEGTLRGEKVG